MLSINVAGVPQTLVGLSTAGSSEKLALCLFEQFFEVRASFKFEKANVEISH